MKNPPTNNSALIALTQFIQSPIVDNQPYPPYSPVNNQIPYFIVILRPACARLQLYSSKIAKITNFALLRAPRLRKDRSIDFRNFFTFFFGYSSRRKWVVAHICALPLALTRSPLLQYPNSLFALKRAITTNIYVNPRSEIVLDFFHSKTRKNIRLGK